LSDDRVDLKAYIDALLEERHRNFESQLRAIEKRTDERGQALDRRLEQMNEIRSALRDSDERKATREELGAFRNEVNRRFDQLLDPASGIYARMNTSGTNLRTWAIALLTAVLLLVIGLVVHILSDGGSSLP